MKIDKAAQSKITKSKDKSSPNIIYKVFLKPTLRPKERAKFIQRPGRKETQAMVIIKII